MLEPLRTRLDRIFRSKPFVPACLAGALMVRVLWVLLIDARPMYECVWYLDRAAEIARGNGYLDGGVPTAYWPVGYPAFLGMIFRLTGPSVLAGKLANVALSVGVVWFVYLFARSLYRSEWVGRLTLLFLSLYPNQIAYCDQLSSEILFGFLLLSGVGLLYWSGERWWGYVLSGGVFGLLCLVKSQTVGIPLIWLALAVARDWHRPGAVRRRVLEGTVVVLAMAAVLGPWMVRNYRVFGHWVFVSTNGGVNLLIGNHPDATGTYVLTDRMVSVYRAGRDEYERDRLARGAALDFIRQSPAKVLGLWPNKLNNLYRWTGSDGIRTCRQGLNPTRTGLANFLCRLESVSEVLYRSVLGLFVIAVVALLFHHRLDRDRQAGTLLVVGIVLYMTGIYLIFFGSARFHFPTIPWMMMHVSALAALVLEPRRTGAPEIGLQPVFAH